MSSTKVNDKPIVERGEEEIKRKGGKKEKRKEKIL